MPSVRFSLNFANLIIIIVIIVMINLSTQSICTLPTVYFQLLDCTSLINKQFIIIIIIIIYSICYVNIKKDIERIGYSNQECILWKKSYLKGACGVTRREGKSN